MKKILLMLSLAVLFSFSLIPQTYAAGELGDLWSTRRSNVTEEEGYMRLDKKDVYEGQASLKVYFKNGYKANTYIKLESIQNVSFDTEKTYIFECQAKSAGTASKMFGKLVWDWTSLGNIDVSSSDWTHFSRTFKPGTAANKFGIVFEGQCNGWIDNLSIRALDENGDPTGVNLLENGGFESGDFTPPADVTDIDTEGMDGAVILSWTNPVDEDFTAVNIYEFDDETETLVTTVVPDGDVSQVRLDGLENGKLYYYRICTRDAAWNESDGVEIYGAPTIDRYYAAPIIAAIGAEQIEKLKQGDISFSTSVTNNRGGDDFTATLITAVYDGMRLTEIKISRAVISEGESAKLENIISVPAAHQNFCVESYLWSDTESMESLYQSKILAE